MSADSAVEMNESPNYIDLCSDEELEKIPTPPPFPNEALGPLTAIQVGEPWDPPVVDLVSPPIMLPVRPMITDEQQQAVNAARAGKPEDRLVVLDEHVLTRGAFDVLCGAGDWWLHESVLGMYLRMIEHRAKELESTLPKVFALDSVTLRYFTQNEYRPPRRIKVDIFNFEIILCPINTMSKHWSLFVINNKKGTIEHLDSMRFRDKVTTNALQRYLVGEHQAVRGETIEPYRVVRRLDIPRQMNGHDCGVFVCVYAEMLSRRAEFNFSQENMPAFRQKIAHELLTGRLMD